MAKKKPSSRQENITITQNNVLSSSKTRSLLLQAIFFIALFILFQLSWQLVRDEAVGHFVRGDMTVKPVVAIINLFSSNIHAVANGNQIIAPGGGLVIKLGCEGVEAMFILIAAIISTKASWSAKIKGVLVGSLLVYIFNQVRILGLFYAFRSDKSLFFLLHNTVTPLVLILLTSMLFYFWLLRYVPSRPLEKQVP